MRTYVFVLCPPYQGSTIIVNLLSSSKNTSTFITAPTWAGESQWLLKYHGDNKYEENRWDPAYNLNMNLVSQLFDIYLDKEKTIFVEKSPPMICRAKLYEDYFSKLGEVYFIISIRNPYTVSYNAAEWIKYAEYQRHNIQTLQNTIVTTYEEICLDLDKFIQKITNKIPALGDIHNQSNSNIDDERGGLIHSNKVNRICDKEIKNEILKYHTELLNFFEYTIMDYT